MSVLKTNEIIAKIYSRLHCEWQVCAIQITPVKFRENGSPVFGSWPSWCLSLFMGLPERFIQHFHIDHNAPCVPPPPPAKKKKFAIVFELSWDDCNTQEKIGNNAYAKFWWINRLHYGLYENGEFSFSNKWRVFKMWVNKLSEIISVRKQPTFGDVTGGFSVKWRPRNERRNSILMTCHYPDLCSASDRLKICFTQSEALTRSR